MADDDRQPVRARCPRCGYDLRGLVATWADRCPLQGVCSECGLTFDWAELLSTKIRKPAWCVEYAPRWWRVPWRALKTLWMMIRPAAFWRSLKMTHAPCPASLAVFYLIQAIIIYMVFAGLAGGVAGATARDRGATLLDAMIAGGYAALLPFSDDPPRWFRDRVTRRAAWGPRMWPWDSVRSHFDDAPDPFELRYTFLTGSTHGLGDSVLIPLLLLGYGFLTMLGAPLGLLALPVSRRRARVKWSHIARITAYSFAPLMVFFLYAVVRFRLVDQGWLGARQWDLTPVYREVWLLSVWVVPLWLIGWWAEAIRRYLKMPHAWSIAVGIVIIGLLIGPLLVLAIWSLLAALVAG